MNPFSHLSALFSFIFRAVVRIKRKREFFHKGVGGRRPGDRNDGRAPESAWGRSVWPLAFHKLVAVSDRREFVEQRMVEVDFTPNPLGRRTPGALFLDRVLRGDAVDWTMSNVPPGKVDRMLVALGLYHVLVR